MEESKNKPHDYGAILSVVKKDGASFTASEIDALSDGLDRLLEAGSFEDALGEPFVSVMEPPQDKQLRFRLSGHYFGNDEEENEDEFGFVEDVEIEEVQKIIAKLSVEFPELVFEAMVDEWDV
jgi:hypothetical protein